jgi:hypothetical protein
MYSVMHTRRMACLLLGIWIGGSLLMALVALNGSRSVARILSDPNAALNLQIKTVGTGEARLLLEYQAARQSRLYFETWAVAQIVLGGVFFFFLLFATGEGKIPLFLALAMLAAVLGQQLLLMPGLSALGRPAGGQSLLSGDAALALSDGGYWAIEIGKLAAALVLAFRLIHRRRRSSGHAGQQVDLVNEANHRHVNR